MYEINPLLNPKCRMNDSGKFPIQIGSSGNVRPCNYYGSRCNWKYLEAWAEANNLDMLKLNIRNSTMAEIYESDVFNAILRGHETLDLPSPCLQLCLKKNQDHPGTGYDETNKGFDSER